MCNGKCCSTLLVRFEVCRRGEERKTLGQHITCGGRLGETRRGEIVGETVAEQERERWREVILG